MLLLTLLCLTTPTHAACTVTDDAGRLIHLNQPAQRIISLAPDITENLFAIGAGSRVVGVVKGSDYPAPAQTITQVGFYSGIDLEKIVSLHPDLIVTWNQTFSRELATLKKMGIAVYTVEPHQLEDIPRTMRHLGCLTGQVQPAEQVSQHFLGRIANLKQQYQSKKVINVFYQMGAYSLLTINKDSWINQAIELCGGRNIFADLHLAAPEISFEAAVAANPSVIINDAYDAAWQKRWKAWPQLSAVKNHLLFSIDPDLIERAGPRLPDGVAHICHDLQLAREHNLL